MGLIKGFKHDVFISYAHADDLRKVKDPGWVGAFGRTLRDALEASLQYQIRATGRDISIYFDYQLEKGLPLDPALKEAVENSATFLIIMSSNYLKSEWCGREAAWFIDIMKSKTSSIDALYQSYKLWPLIVCEVGPTNREEWPDEIVRSAPPFRFYHPDKESGDKRLAYPTIDVEPLDSALFFERINDLQSAIAGRIQKICKKEEEEKILLSQNPKDKNTLSEDGLRKKAVSTTKILNKNILLISTPDERRKLNEFTDFCKSIGGQVIAPDHQHGKIWDVHDISGDTLSIGAVVLLLGTSPGDEGFVSMLGAAYEFAKDQHIDYFIWQRPKITLNYLEEFLEEDEHEYLEFIKLISKDLQKSSFIQFMTDVTNSLKYSIDKTSSKMTVYIDAEQEDFSIVVKIREAIARQRLRVRTHHPREPLRAELLDRCDGVVLVMGDISVDTIYDKLDIYDKEAAERRKKTGTEIPIAIADVSPPPPFEEDMWDTEVEILRIEPEDDQSFDCIASFISSLGGNAPGKEPPKGQTN